MASVVTRRLRVTFCTESTPRNSVHWSLRGHAGIELDLAEGGFVAGDILLKQAQQCFRLLWTEINALKIADFDLGLGLLLQCPENQEKVPYVDPHLHAICVVFAIIGIVGQLYVWLWRISHKAKV
jgi:hypothetical protein